MCYTVLVILYMSIYFFSRDINLTLRIFKFLGMEESFASFFLKLTFSILKEKKSEFHKNTLKIFEGGVKDKNK